MKLYFQCLLVYLKLEFWALEKRVIISQHWLRMNKALKEIRTLLHKSGEFLVIFRKLGFDIYVE